MPEEMWNRLYAGQAVNVRGSNSETEATRLDENPQWGVAIVDAAIEPVKYGDVTRWRVRFAYFDPKGVAQESADEVLTLTWKPGDDCIAVFPPEQPALANFRPLGAA